MQRLPSFRLCPPPYARLVIALASLVGLFASAYLLVTYVNGGPIACATTTGCELVRASRWAYIYGIPRPVLGVLFYAGLFGLLVLRVTLSWRPRFLYRLTMLAAIVGVIESAYLFLIQWLSIGAFCTWCLISGLMTLIIACLAPSDVFEETRHVARDRELRWYAYALLAFLPLTLVGILFLTR